MPKRGKIDIGDLSMKAAAPARQEASPAPDPSVDDPRATQDQPEVETENPSYDPPPRRPRAQREHAFDVASWLLEGVVGIAEELRHNDLGLPEEFWTHAYAARKETLLAARTLLDVAIERCDESSPPSKRKQRKQRGNVDISFKSKE